MNSPSLDLDRPVNTGAVSLAPEQLHRSALARPFLATMAMVAVLGAIYYAFIATPMYVSETRFTIHSQQATAPTTLLAGLAGKDTGLADITAVQDHILSLEMANALDRQFGLRRAYGQFRPDFPRWLRPGASDAAFLKFYRRMVIVKLDREANIVEIDVRAFDRDTPEPIATTLLERTEAFVDGMTQRVRSETMRSAQGELNRAQQQADAARLAVGAFRGATSSVDPRMSGSQLLGGEGAMETQAATAQAELASALTFNRPDAPAVRQLRAKLAAIQAQGARMKARQGAGGQAGQVTSYETLIVQRETAERKLAGALGAYDTARALSQQREKYVVRVVNPSRPDRPTEPKRVRDFLMVMIFALAGYAIVSLAIAGIRDHRGV